MFIILDLRHSTIVFTLSTVFYWIARGNVFPKYIQIETSGTPAFKAHRLAISRIVFSTGFHHVSLLYAPIYRRNWPDNDS